MFRKMMGKKNNVNIPSLVRGQEVLVLNKDKADLLGETFAAVHSGDQLTDTHRRQMIQKIGNHKNSLEKYQKYMSTLDMNITMKEIKTVLKGTGYSAPGEDQLCYAMFRQIPEVTLKLILKLFNKIWKEGSIPNSWKRAIILPFNKPGKDPTCPNNYRPIVLTSHFSKWMEKIIVNRLGYYLEKNNLINGYQCGFRTGRSTMDALTRVSNEIEKALKMKELMIIVFFDIEKAYDSLWKEGLLIKMKQMGIGGRMYNWIANFLLDRKIRVKIGNDYSKEFNVENGIPQGSAISPILFNIMINDIFYDTDKCIKSALYADDGVIWMKGKNIKYVVGNIKKAISKVEKWSYEWGFKLSASKSCYMVVTKKRNINIETITLYGQTLERVTEYKYLGLWLDSTYSWKTHLDNLETKYKKVINLLKAVAGNNWGADRQSLLSIYRALMRSIIDYGSIIYGAAAKTSLQKIDRLQCRALRICTGAAKTTPINALLIETGETPLEMRRIKLALAYWMKIKSNKDDNVNSIILQNCWEYLKFQSNGFGWMVRKWIKMYRLDDKEIAHFNPISVIPPWLVPEVNVDLKINTMKNDWNLNEIGIKTDIYLRNTYNNYLKIYTDGSKNLKGYVGIGIYISEFKKFISKRISDQLSVFTAEMVAVILSLQWVEEVRPDRVVVCTDSKAVVESIKGEGNDRKDLVLEIPHILFRLYRGGIDVWFCWVPAHEGVKGNEKADKLAKRALEGEITISIPFGKGEGKSLIKSKEMAKNVE
uniref:Reverse transcriptase domain-containing protein n=1 Tax=Xiphophorus maculatus TaxID=8083 RepID=A0A3B5QMN0_XIPMA